MKFAITLLLFTAVTALTGCTGMKVTAERDPSFDFSPVATFQWIDAPAEILNAEDTYLNEDIQKALNNELSGRGWKQVLNADNADLQVVYYIKLKQHQEYTAEPKRDEREFSGGFVYDRSRKNWSYEERSPDLNVYTVEVGTLMMVIYDTETGNRVWRGSLQTKLDRSKPIEKRRDLIRTVAHKLVERIPRSAR